MNEIKINAADILNYIKRTGMHPNFDLAVTEFCPYNEARRIDLFYYSRWNRQTKGYEIKVSRSDFLQDKKWQEYLKFCTWFSFIAPKGVIKKEELPENIGLIEIDVYQLAIKHNWEDNSDLEDGGIFYRFKSEAIRRPKRLRETIENDDYIRLLEGLIMKLIYNKNLLSDLQK